MSTPATRRLLKDLDEVSKTQENYSIYAEPLEDDLFTWVAVISGPKGTPYEGGTFSLVLTFDDEYPQHAPEVCFLSKMFHPNVYPNGDLCLDILKNKWSPSYNVTAILLSVQSLLNDPNINSPANMEAAEMYEKNKEEYKKKVREIVESSWNDIE
ncbi:hypothetical protein NUSPORA_01324 [Nucleospora cyclopteri]